jgi:hypothetical protein
MRSPKITLNPPRDGIQEAQVCAGEQSVLMTISPFSPDNNTCYHDDGARIDLSFVDYNAPLLVTVDLAYVSVPGYYFIHRTADERAYLRVMPCINALAKIQQRLDKRTWSADTLAAIADDLRAAGLLVREPDEPTS